MILQGPRTELAYGGFPAERMLPADTFQLSFPLDHAQPPSIQGPISEPEILTMPPSLPLTSTRFTDLNSEKRAKTDSGWVLEHHSFIFCHVLAYVGHERQTEWGRDQTFSASGCVICHFLMVQIQFPFLSIVIH